MIIKSAYVPYHASKWLSVATLIDINEMRSLFDYLGNFHLYSIGTVIGRDKSVLPHSTFLSCYEDYIHTIKKGQIPEDSFYRPFFASAMTVSNDHVYSLHVSSDSQIIRVSKPVIQMQAHNLDYSMADGKFHPMVFGKDSILWGIQFSYPQLYEDPDTHEVHKVIDSPQFPNTNLFRSLQKWIRENTVPTPFIVNDQVVNVPMRLGKQCFSWINQHPQFAKKGLKVFSKD